MYVRGGGDVNETVLPIRQEHSFGSATVGDDVVMAGTADQTSSHFPSDMQAAPAPTQNSFQVDAQTGKPTANTPTIVVLSGPEGPPSPCEQQQGDQELIEDDVTGVGMGASAAVAAEDPGRQVHEAIHDIVTGLVDEVITAEDPALEAHEALHDIVTSLVDEVVIAKDHGRQIHETTRDIVSSVVDEVVAAQERDQEAKSIAEDILRGILDVVARMTIEVAPEPLGGQAHPAGEIDPPPHSDHLHLSAAGIGPGSDAQAGEQDGQPDPPQADDHFSLPLDDSAMEGAGPEEDEAMDWTLVDLQDDASEEVILLADPAEAEDIEPVEDALPRQLDGAADESNSLAAILDACVSRVYTGSGTAWMPAAPGARPGSPRPRPQVETEPEQMPERRLTRSQRRALEQNDHVHL